jgi:peptidoglycan hydrolase CwlO-like protein
MDVGAASIIVAIVTTVGTITVAYMNKVHKDNRKDHAYVVGTIKEMHTDVKDVKQDIQEVKIDVGVLKERQADIKERVERLERSDNA